MKRNLLLLIPVASLLLLLSGCGVTRINSETTYPITKEVVPSYKKDQSVTLSNFYSKPTVVNLVEGSLDGDLMQYTDTAMELLKQGLAHQDITVGAGGKKTVKLRVFNTKFERGFWTMRADVNISAELGNGKKINVYHHNASPMSAYRAVSGAITRATEKILKHKDFLLYMNE